MNSKSRLKHADVADIVIVGAGPAGALCAAELSKMQYKVLLIDAGDPRARIEGLSTRAVNLLRGKRMHHALSAVSRSLPRSVHWGEQRSTENGEHLVARPQFDHGLCTDAQKAGAKLIKGRVIHFEKSAISTRWSVILAENVQVRCNMLIDARGRQANPSNKNNAAPSNIALCSYVENTRFAAGTHIQAISDGWLWLAKPNAETPVWAQLMLHKGAQKLGRREAPKILLNSVEKVLDQSGLQLVGEPISRGADFRLNLTNSDPLSPLKLGDACAAFDPLSGHGMFWAFSSALSGAAIVNTLLQDTRESSRDLCKAFYEQRLHFTFLRQTRVGRDFYRLEKKRKSSFWQTRKRWPDSLPSHPEVVETAQFDRGPVIDNGRVVEQERVLLPGEYGPSAWFGSIPLVRAIRKLQTMKQAARNDPEQFRKCCVPNASPREAQQFWIWLQSKNLLGNKLHEIS